MDERTGFDVNSRSTRWSAILFGVVGVQTFIIQPGFVQGLIEQLRFSERQAGLVASAEVAGIALTALALAFLSPRLDWRSTIRVGAVLAASPAARWACCAWPAPGQSVPGQSGGPRAALEADRGLRYQTCDNQRAQAGSPA